MHQLTLPARLGRTVLVALLAMALTLSVLVVADVVKAPDAGAAVPAVLDTSDGQVSADVLPTVQLNGVVWDQAIVGNTVYVVGSFSQARPAGSPAGTNQTPRANVLAYDITNGQLRTQFVANTNAQAKTVAASPDGSRIYIGGSFTNVNGTNRYRVAALNPTTGAVIQDFRAGTDYTVNALAVSSTTLYIGGAFGSAGSPTSQPRNRLAAFSTSTGALQSWAPSPNLTVQALTVGPGEERVFVGGAFTQINGTNAYGMGALDPVTGAVIPWAANTVIQNGGIDGAILDLRTSGNSIYGSGYTYGRDAGNLEGAFRASASTGAIEWVEDCHGDTQQVAPANGYVYTASHAHVCANTGGFPQSDGTQNQWHFNMRPALSFRDEATGTLRREQWSYHNLEGLPAPSLTTWFPDFETGTVTGAGQSVWAVEANSDYVVYGGEFPRVNGQNQQGLLRFARRPLSPRNSGPRISGAAFPIKVVSPAAGQVRVSFPANYDRDDGVLSYRITRNGSTVHTTDVKSTFYDRTTVSFHEDGLNQGQSYTYRVTATDRDGNSALSDPVPVTVSSSRAPSPYADLVVSDGPRIYWRLGDAPGSTSAQDSAAYQTGIVNSMTFGRPGAIVGDADTAVTTTGTSSRIVQTPFLNNQLQNERHPTVDEFTVEAWFNTTSGSGGRLLGFGNSNSGNSSSSSADRVLYLTNNGRATFGVRTRPEGPGSSGTRVNRTIESAAGLNDGQWHHVVGTLSSGVGMQLYVDGVRVSSRDDVNSGTAYNGYWRVGADTLSGWNNSPSSTRLTGDIDEAAVYYHELSAAQIAAHYTASGRTPAIAPAPADAYGTAVHALDPYLYYRLAEPSGSTVIDSGIQAHTGDYDGPQSPGQTGVVPGNAAVAFAGSGSASDRNRLDTPGAFSLETWFNTTTSTGGKLIGFGSSRTGLSGTSDRHVYLRDDGRLAFGVGGAAAAEITTTHQVNDGQWHHVVASQGPDGMALYVDGTLVGNASAKTGATYRGYWRIGGDATPSGSTANFFTGRLDEVAVYDTPLTEAQIQQHLALGGGEVTNIPPTAAFAATAEFLTLSFDAESSEDVDGNIVSYEWDFGDGDTDTGETVSHDYQTGGSYDVTLTVTDNAGGVDQITQSYLVSEPPPNIAPTAAFDIEVTALRVDLDAVDSEDVDGTIVSYEWDFGDGGTDTGEAVSHTYLEEGTYLITLTVTDDDDGVDQDTQSVSVAPATGPEVYATDTFSRTVVNGMGVADTGQAWTIQGNSTQYSVSGGQGRHRMAAAGASPTSFVNAVLGQDVLTTIDVAFDKAPTGGGLYSSLIVRRAGTSDYRVRVRAMPASTSITLFRTVNGAETSLGGVSVPGLVYQPGDVLRIQLQAVGNGTTALGAKVWKVGEAEPATWQVTANDATASLQAPGGMGLVTYLSGSSTNAPVVASYDGLQVLEG